MKVGDLARIKLRADPEMDRLYSGYVVKIERARPFSKLYYVTTDGINLQQNVSFNVWVHESELESITPADLRAAWTDSKRSGLIYEFRNQ
jgi:hypothetical protein